MPPVLQKVRAGEVIKAEQFNALVEAVREAQLQSGVGYGLKRGPGGTTLTIYPQPAGRTTTSTAGGTSHPFQVSLRVTSGGYEAYVESGDMKKSLRPNDKQTIVGLQAWFTAVTNDLIFLQATVTNYAVTACEVNSIGQGDSFAATTGAWASNAYVTASGGVTSPQNAFRYLLAQVLTAGTTPETLRVVQIADSHVLVRNICVDGRPAIYPFEDSAAMTIV